MSKLKLKIVAPEKTILETTCDMVVAPGFEGEFGIMPNHTALLNALQTGKIKIYDGDNISNEIFISSGLCKLENDEATILVEEVIDLNKVEEKDISEKIANLSQKISSSDTDDEIHKLQQEINSLEKIKEAA